MHFDPILSISFFINSPCFSWRPQIVIALAPLCAKSLAVSAPLPCRALFALLTLYIIFSDKEFKSILDQTKRVELCLIGNKLQIHVWKALLKIPPGKVISYMTLAKYIGKPKAVRTIATAIGKNPLCWLIPCHRVLRANGELGGYHWGLNVKRKMLTYESKMINHDTEI